MARHEAPGTLTSGGISLRRPVYPIATIVAASGRRVHVIAVTTTFYPSLHFYDWSESKRQLARRKIDLFRRCAELVPEARSLICVHFVGEHGPTPFAHEVDTSHAMMPSATPITK